MRLVTLTRDMRPYQAGHDAALPDALAEKLMSAGDATPSANEAGAGFQPDALQPQPDAPQPRNRLPRGRYFPRRGG